jgi:hypothetical protein
LTKGEGEDDEDEERKENYKSHENKIVEASVEKI